MRNVVKLAVYAGMGLYDQLRDFVEELVKRGELMQHEGEEILSEAKVQEEARSKTLQARLEETVRGAVDKLPMPASAKDVAALEERIRLLEEKLLEAAEEAPTT